MVLIFLQKKLIGRMYRFIYKKEFLFILIFFSLVLLSCNVGYEFIRKYNVGQKYKAYSHEVMLEYKYSKVRRLSSGIPHVLVTKEKYKIIFIKYKKHYLYLNTIQVISDGKYLDKIIDHKFKISALPQKIKISGFTIKILSLKNTTKFQKKQAIRYQILSENEKIMGETKNNSRNKGLKR